MAVRARGGSGHVHQRVRTGGSTGLVRDSAALPFRDPGRVSGYAQPPAWDIGDSATGARAIPRGCGGRAGNSPKPARAEAGASPGPTFKLQLLLTLQTLPEAPTPLRVLARLSYAAQQNCGGLPPERFAAMNGYSRQLSAAARPALNSPIKWSCSVPILSGRLFGGDSLANCGPTNQVRPTSLTGFASDWADPSCLVVSR